MNERIGIFSFFSGAGFLDLGFESSVFDTLLVNEYHAPFAKMHREARKAMGMALPAYGYHVTDIRDFLEGEKLDHLRKSIADARKQYTFNGFIGGPPCPDFSVGGKNRGKEGENGVLSDIYIELICKVRPDFFLFENVKGLWRTKKHRSFYEHLKSKLRDNGYVMSEKLINSIEYGVPQDRDRIILIGVHENSLVEHEYEFNGTKLLWNLGWEKQMSFDKKTVFSLPWPKTNVFEELNDASQMDVSPPSNVPLELTTQYWFNRNQVEDHPNSAQFFVPRAGLSKFQSIAEGDDSKKSYKRLHRWRYSPTAAYGNNEVHLHPYIARRISIAEALAIQSLPKEFVLPADITLSNGFKAIGNGVPYLAAKGLAEMLGQFLINLRNKDRYAHGHNADGPEPGGRYRRPSQAIQLSVFEPEQ